MAELSKFFKSSQELTDYLNGENIPSNVLGVVVEDNEVKEIAFGTNNIEGEYKTYRVTDEYPTPTGTINITENGESIDVKQYATANVNVPQPKIYAFCYYNEQYGSGISPAGTGIGSSPLGWEILTGETYDMVVIASPEVAQHLGQLYLKADNHDEKRDFTNATVTTTTADGQTFARIALTGSYPSLSDMNEVGLYYNDTKYIAVVAG